MFIEKKTNFLGVPFLTFNEKALRDSLEVTFEQSLVPMFEKREKTDPSGARVVATKITVKATFSKEEFAIFEEQQEIRRANYNSVDGTILHRYGREGSVLRGGWSGRITPKYQGCRSEKAKRAKEEKVFAEAKKEDYTWRVDDCVDGFVKTFKQYVTAHNEHAEDQIKSFYKRECDWEWDGVNLEWGQNLELNNLEQKAKKLEEQLATIKNRSAELRNIRSNNRQKALAEAFAKEDAGYVPEPLKTELVNALNNGSQFEKRRRRPARLVIG